ncbi:hypothetical protein O23A_p4222 [Aeromonas salmonicida]|nr:hypothetical protein O23A_p4222 [Aeromonas salmonicida]
MVCGVKAGLSLRDVTVVVKRYSGDTLLRPFLHGVETGHSENF